MKILVVQLNGVLEYQINLAKIREFILEAKAKHGVIDAVFLPEVFYSISNGLVPTPYLVEKGNEHYINIQNLAKEHNVYLVGGSAASKVQDQIMNRAYIFAPTGEELVNYDKMHLFRLTLKGAEKELVVDEGKIYNAGNKPVMCNILDWKIGLSICFDIRFPELYRYYQHQNVDLITICAAFTVPTGKAHFETLVRARAIETGAFVVASTQWGVHNERTTTFGHSMVVAPWGEILLNLGEGETSGVLDLSKNDIILAKQRLNTKYQHEFKYD